MTVFMQYLRENRRGFAGWAVAITAVAAMYSAFWPVFGHNTGLTGAIDAFPQAMKDAFHMTDYSTPAGYFGSTVFGLLVPILVAVFAIAAGVRAIAGDEEADTLELVLAHPVTRTRLALARYAATVAAMAGCGALLFVVIVLIRVPAKFTELPVGNIAATVLMLTLFGVCFASIAYGIGASTGRRAISLGAGAYLAVVTYLCSSFLPQIRGLGWVKYFSPFAWYLDGQPLRNGINWIYCGLFVAVAMVFAALGIWRFRSRDLT
jgi:beta-exotoxin I transport system permease protein